MKENNVKTRDRTSIEMFFDSIDLQGINILEVCQAGAAHEVTIVLFSRIFYDAKELTDFPPYMISCLQKVGSRISAKGRISYLQKVGYHVYKR